MTEYEVQLFYDPQRIKPEFIQKIYQGFDLKSPSEEELKIPFHTDPSTKKQTSTTRFITSKKTKVLSLTNMVMELPSIRIEIQSLPK